MAVLNVIVSTSGECFGIQEIDFTEVTPRDILSYFEETKLIPPSRGEGTRAILKGNRVLDDNMSLDRLGVEDGDEIHIMERFGMYG